jgi:hypothetical protein
LSHRDAEAILHSNAAIKIDPQYKFEENTKEVY